MTVTQGNNHLALYGKEVWLIHSIGFVFARQSLGRRIHFNANCSRPAKPEPVYPLFPLNRSTVPKEIAFNAYCRLFRLQDAATGKRCGKIDTKEKA